MNKKRERGTGRGDLDKRTKPCSPNSLLMSWELTQSCKKFKEIINYRLEFEQRVLDLQERASGTRPVVPVICNWCPLQLWCRRCCYCEQIALIMVEQYLMNYNCRRFFFEVPFLYKFGGEAGFFLLNKVQRLFVIESWLKPRKWHKKPFVR